MYTMERTFINKSRTALFMAAAILFALSSCDKNDKDAEPEKIEVNVLWSDFFTYSSQGTIELPVSISGITTAPKTEDFRLITTMESFSSVTYSWDSSKNKSAEGRAATQKWRLKVNDVEEDEDGEDLYWLTLDYDFTDCMRSTVECELWYGDRKAEVTFCIKNHAMSHNTIGVDNTVFVKDNSRLDDLFIPLDAAFAKLNIATSDFYDTQLYEFYCAKAGDKPNLSKPGYWEGNEDTFVTYGSEGAEYGMFIMLDESLDAGNYVVKLIIAKGDKKYVGISVPFTITESNFFV